MVAVSLLPYLALLGGIEVDLERVKGFAAGSLVRNDSLAWT